MASEGQVDPWVRVRSESELRPGMAVQFRNCRICSKRCTEVIAEVDDAHLFECIEHGRHCVSVRGLILSHWEVEPQEWGCLANQIREGRLFRLADSSLSSDSESTETPMELERVR